MIPLRDANPVRGIPIVNRLLLAVNLVAWIYVVYLTRQPGATGAWPVDLRGDGDVGVETEVAGGDHGERHGGYVDPQG